MDFGRRAERGWLPLKMWRCSAICDDVGATFELQRSEWRPPPPEDGMAAAPLAGGQ